MGPFSQTAFPTSADLLFSSLLHFRQCSSSKFALSEFNGSKTRIADKVEMRNPQVLIELAAKNCFQSRQTIGSSHIFVADPAVV
jgi:hypothetical protein